MRVLISPDGTIMQMLYKDHHPLADVGYIKTVIRATDVRFDPALKKWCVYKPNSNEKLMEKVFDTRQAAIEAEVQMLESKEFDKAPKIC